MPAVRLRGVRASAVRRQRGAIPLLAAILIAALLLPIAWTWFTLSWSYSEGERAGIVQKFSRKGWLCKTYEGELAQYVVAGVAPQIWPFTVRDAKVAEELRSLVGTRVQLHYTEHVGVPTSCFGETGYYVDAIVRLHESPNPGLPSTPALAPPHRPRTEAGVRSRARTRRPVDAARRPPSSPTSRRRRGACGAQRFGEYGTGNQR